MVTDGPFTETKEFRSAGFDILECDSLEEAVEIAARHPVARTGTIDVRPLGELTTELTRSLTIAPPTPI
jgi:hypothetical protein